MKQNEKDKQDFEVISNFGRKLVESQKPVDSDIQRIVDEHWFEMLWNFAWAINKSMKNILILVNTQ